VDLLSFLRYENISDANPIICFVGDEYPALFFSPIKQKLKNFLPLVTIDSITNDAELKSHLEMSFLGSKTIYCLSPNLIESNPHLLRYLMEYKGPNIISFFSQKLKSTDNTLSVDLPSEINYTLFLELFTTLYPLYGKKSSSFIKNIFNNYNSLSLDSSYLLMHYCILIGNKSEIFMQEWLSSIVHPEKSLFTLSTYFFAKKGPLFFELWNSISHDYSDLFWITYWSEQLFKAHAFILMNKNNNFLQAKKIAYRLPFSFIQKDWKSISLLELQNAHNHLYNLDWNIKNGLSTNFEHFYLQFFLNKLQ
jgi:hypothetical protein